jgi:hypothetical protein
MCVLQRWVFGLCPEEVAVQKTERETGDHDYYEKVSGALII